jgi:CDP-glucose 4,6-dehydratase
MDLSPNLWRGKRILVTGHTGFKGSWLTALLADLGAKVIGYSLPAVKPHSLYIDGNVSNLLFAEYISDIQDADMIEYVIGAEKIDYVFHLAAQAFVRSSVKEPLRTINTNVIGTTNVLLSALNSQTVLGITLVTTDKVYENFDMGLPYTESDNLGGNEPYSASKAASELIIKALSQSNNSRKIPVTTVRAGNVIGGGDWGEDILVPDMIRAIIFSSVLNIRNPNSTRPWQYVLDCLFGYLLVAEAHLSRKSDIPSAFNFGPSDSLSVLNVIELFEKALDRKIEYQIFQTDIHEHTRLTLDSSLAKRFLGWQPSLSPTESVTKTVNWYHEFINGFDAFQLMQNEILMYRKKK